MIDLPKSPGSSGQTNTSPVQEVKPSQLARQQVSQTVQAVVLEAKLVQESGSAGKAVYEILLRASAAAGTSPPLAGNANAAAVTTPALNQITTEAMHQLRQGQSLLIKTNASFPIPPGTQLLATAAPSRGIVISQILPPQLATIINQTLRELVPQQQGLNPLFQLLETVASRPADNANRAILNLPTLTAALLQLLPKLEQLKTADQVRQAISNSGLFLENKIQQAIQRPGAQLNTHSGASSSSVSTSSTNTNPSATSGTASGHRSGGDGPLGEGLRILSEKMKAAVTGKATAAATDNPSRSTAPEVTTLINRDIKHALQQLQVRLEKADAAIKQSSPPQQAPTPAAETGKAANASEGGKPGPAAGANPVTATSPDSTINKIRGDAGYRSPANAAPSMGAENRTPATPNTTGKIQGYSSVHSASQMTDPAQKSSLETFLLPPLPGNIALQPQPRSKHSTGGDMADALVSILLKQVKGALSRITLHQLASHPRSQDPASPQPLLSFELPILHQGQVQVFQFMIEEQEAQGEQENKPVGKRWVVQMAFDIDGLGPMLCQISMLGQSASVSFWAEWENTLQHTRNHFDYLQNVLTEMGLRVEKLQGHLGIPKSEQAILQNQLVDIRT